MPVNKENYITIKKELDLKQVTLVAVSKTKPAEDTLELYRLGHRDFGENYVQELVEKAEKLPSDIRWHFIGHLQTNKVKLIVPLVQLIHGVDSLKLLKEINKEAAKANKIVNCLVQVHIAQEETKFGLDEEELMMIMQNTNLYPHIRICGLMGMASFTDDMNIVREEFKKLKKVFGRAAPLTIHHSLFTILSMGMSGDYKLAIEEGSTMVRIGSLLFGERQKK